MVNKAGWFAEFVKRDKNRICHGEEEAFGEGDELVAENEHERYRQDVQGLVNPDLHPPLGAGQAGRYLYVGLVFLSHGYILPQVFAVQEKGPGGYRGPLSGLGGLLQEQRSCAGAAGGGIDSPLRGDPFEHRGREAEDHADEQAYQRLIPFALEGFIGGENEADGGAGNHQVPDDIEPRAGVGGQLIGVLGVGGHGESQGEEQEG